MFSDVRFISRMKKLSNLFKRSGNRRETNETEFCFNMFTLEMDDYTWFNEFDVGHVFLKFVCHGREQIERLQFDGDEKLDKWKVFFKSEMICDGLEF